MRRFVLSCLFLTLVGKEAIGAPLSKPLNRLTHLEVLCDALNAHLIEKPLSLFAEVENFAFLPYDSDLELLSLDSTRVLVGLEGALELLPSPARALDASLSPKEAEAIQTLAARKEIVALAAFLPRTTKETPCVTRVENGKTIYRLEVDLRVVEIIRRSNKRPLLRYQVDSYPEEVAATPSDTRLEVLFTKPSLLEGELVLERLQKATKRLRPELERCYAQGLKTNRLAQGTFTLHISINRQGNAEGVDVTIDTFGDEMVHHCVIEEIARGRYPRPVKGPASVSFTVYFLQKSSQ